MKSKIHSIEHLFRHQLEHIYGAECKVRDLAKLSLPITSQVAHDCIKKYISESADKILKLQRIFGYLMTEPSHPRNEQMETLARELKEAFWLTGSSYLKDIMITISFKDINAYKISCYRDAYLSCVELELDTPADLLEQILEWEFAAKKSFSSLALTEFNRSRSALEK